MTIGSFIRLFSLPVAVAITALGISGKALAADQPAAAAPAAVAGEPGAACATCNSAAAACDSCGKMHKSCLHCKKSCKPYQTTLCPGACFGYFQTQWHRWENVCPIPYQGVGLSDSPVRSLPPVSAPPVVSPKTTGSDGPIPKTGVPVIPPVPGK